MSEILCICKVQKTPAWWVIMDCGHWYKWTGEKKPRVGEDLDCPTCGMPEVIPRLHNDQS